MLSSTKSSAKVATQPLHYVVVSLSILAEKNICYHISFFITFLQAKGIKIKVHFGADCEQRLKNGNDEFSF